MFLFALVFLITALITGTVRTLLVRHGVMDLPNARSSHAVPVPRGGGVGIVVVFLSAVIWILRSHGIPRGLGWALAGGGLAIGIVGFLDDRFKLAQWPRLMIHCLAAAWALWCLNATHPLQFSGGTPGFWVGRAVALVGLVWLTNLFNFMDGIDGLAAVEAVCVSAFGALLVANNGLLAEAQVSWGCWLPRAWDSWSGIGRLQRSSWVMQEADSSDSRWECWLSSPQRRIQSSSGRG